MTFCENLLTSTKTSSWLLGRDLWLRRPYISFTTAEDILSGVTLSSEVYILKSDGSSDFQTSIGDYASGSSSQRLRPLRPSQNDTYLLEIFKENEGSPERIFYCRSKFSGILNRHSIRELILCNHLRYLYNFYHYTSWPDRRCPVLTMNIWHIWPWILKVGIQFSWISFVAPDDVIWKQWLYY